MNWKDINNTLVNFLQNFYNKNKNNSGDALYNLLINNKTFVENNHWISKFELPYGEKSVDPFHIFASIYNANLSDSMVEKKIEVLFKTLSLKKVNVDTDFNGVPFLMPIKILSSRKIETQKEIWTLFYEVYNKIEISNFEKYKNWFGIDLEILSVFLFYINPEKYMPLDKNSINLLRKFEIYTPKDFLEYTNINKKIEKYNIDNNLFMELYLISYLIVFKQKTDNILSNNLIKFINSIKK